MQAKLDLIRVRLNVTPKSLTATALGLILWIAYAIATIWPDSFWGIHHISFLSPILKALYLFSSLLLILAGLINIPDFSINNRYKWLLTITTPIICALAYFHFPFAASLTGDAELFRLKLGERTTELYPVFFEKLLSLNILHPKTGNTTVLSGIRLMSYYFDISHHNAYRLLGACSGGLFIFIWLTFATKLKLSSSKFAIAAILGVLAPFTQFFFGYEEIYAPAYPVQFAFLVVHVVSYRNPKVRWLQAQLVLGFLCMKFHAVFVLLFPSVFLSIIYLAACKLQLPTKWFSWRNMMLLVLVPITLFGLFTYFFITKDYNDPRFLNGDVNMYERLFLPLLSPVPPLDRYNLVSLNHIADYINMLFHWFGGGLLIAAAAGTLYRNYIRWNRPEIISIGLASILFLMVFFVYNPLMSMPYDYDLFSIPGPVFLMFILLVITSLNESKKLNYLIGPVLGICLLTIPVFQVNASPSALSHRLENVGRHVFKTYWTRSAGDIRGAIEMSNNVDEKILRYEVSISNLEPIANVGNDTEYAHLLLELAKLHRTSKGDYLKGLQYHELVKSYDDSLLANYIGLMESNYMLGNYTTAFDYSKVLVENKFPTEQEALRIAIECSYRAAQYHDTQKYCSAYLEKWDDANISELFRQLQLEIIDR